MGGQQTERGRPEMYRGHNIFLPGNHRFRQKAPIRRERGMAWDCQASRGGLNTHTKGCEQAEAEKEKMSIETREVMEGPRPLLSLATLLHERVPSHAPLPVLPIH